MWGSWYIFYVYIHAINFSACNYPLTQGGFTPLYIASRKGHSDVVKTLIQNGADINLANKVWRLLSQDHWQRINHCIQLTAIRPYTNLPTVHYHTVWLYPHWKPYHDCKFFVTFTLSLLPTALHTSHSLLAVFTDLNLQSQMREATYAFAQFRNSVHAHFERSNYDGLHTHEIACFILVSEYLFYLHYRLVHHLCS